jgi:hypothetical protein
MLNRRVISREQENGTCCIYSNHRPCTVLDSLPKYVDDDDVDDDNDYLQLLKFSCIIYQSCSNILAYTAVTIFRQVVPAFQQIMKLQFQDENGHCNLSQSTATVSTYDVTKPKD